MISDYLIYKGKQEKTLTLKINNEYISYKIKLKNNININDLNSLYNNIYIGLNYLYTNYRGTIVPYDFINILNELLISDYIDLTKMLKIIENQEHLGTYKIAIDKFLSLFAVYRSSSYVYNEDIIDINTMIANNLYGLYSHKVKKLARA